ncbi:MAG: efflux RND transporter periplasmic adaptor subunit [Gemmatimonadetes bacterium]|nr:efflux RND transporter periplasmic adaptor subunit [Gemmatimonadota bacterium]
MIHVRFWGAVLMAPLMVGCGNSDADDAPSIQSTAVFRGDLMITAEATGTVEPIRKVEVKSKASGEVLRLYVDIGDKVEPGALLAEVDPRDVRNALDQAVADLDVARARLEISQAQLERSEELLQAGVISAQEHEARRLEFANSRASLVRAETNHELAQLRMTDVTIRAPLAGTVLEKNVEEGQVIQSASQNVSGGTTLMVMANLESMQVRTLVDETDMGEIRPGMQANVTVEAYPTRLFVGLVEKIEPQAIVQQNVTMFPVIVQLDNDSGLLRPGMNAEVEIELAQAIGVLLIPNNAVVTPQDAQPAAMVLGLDPEALDMRSLFGGGRGGGRRGGGARAQGQGAGEGSGGPGSTGGRPFGGQRDAPEGADSGGREFGAGRGPGGGPGGGAFDSLRALIASGEISQDSARALFSAQRGGPGGGGSFGSGGGRPGGQGVQGGVDAAASRRDTRRAVVFVMNEAGVIEPRAVMIGLNDWDFTEVVSGLEEGEQIAIVGAAQLRAQQDEFLNRIRSNSNPFGGGGPPGRGGFR